MQKTKALTLIALFVMLSLTSMGCKGGSPEAQRKAQDLKLSYWTVDTREDAVRSIVQTYRADHPNVTFDIQVIPEDEYEQRLLEAWADDAGPDLFSIKNTWVGKYESKIEPMPGSTYLPYQIITGTLKKEAKWVLSERTTYTPQTFVNTFVPQVATDALRDGKVYGIPLSFDSLAMYVNRDVLNNSGIIAVPRTWIPFAQAVNSMTLRDPDNNIIQSAVAMGRVDNVLYAQDIVSLLMMQNGANMTEGESNRAVFDKSVKTPAGNTIQPGTQAALFYADFATPGKEVYTWNQGFPSSLEAFASGQTAIFFGYARDKRVIRDISPALNFEINPFPQIDGSPVKMNFASYWLETVSKRSDNTEWAWDFIVYATGEKRASKYIEEANLPTALRTLLASQSADDPEMEVFNQQALTASSWYQGKQPDVALTIFGEIIEEINAGERSNVGRLLKDAASKINQTL
ncbi:MAG: ABC transporter substrate-binding protein [Patescibacteria group bacterium]